MMASIMAAIPSTAAVTAVPVRSAALVCTIFPAGSTALICPVLPASSVFLLSRAYLPVVMPALGFPLMLSASHDPLLDFPHGHSMAIL